jgi:hypothetical protein
MSNENVIGLSFGSTVDTEARSEIAGKLQRREPAALAAGVVDITFHCTHCGQKGTVTVAWGDHHCLPKGWCSRDAVPTYALARRTDHIFACSAKCARALNKKHPPPARPKWFKFA